MTTHKIITIGRQFGSGGHEIGNLLATRLDIPLYDNNLVRMVAKKLDIREETAQAVDETMINNFLAGYVFAPMEESVKLPDADMIQPLNEQVHEMQTEIIRKFADRGSCVIVGRCADYVLKDYANCISVFICADREDRIGRIAKRYDMSERKAAEKIKKVDRERKYYYESHTGYEWGGTDTYPVILNVSRLGVERTVDVLEMLYKL